MLIPDHDPDHARRITVADEIRNQNVVAVYRQYDGRWIAQVGPGDGRGLKAVGAWPAQALRRLATYADVCGWVFDPSYRPRPGTIHDA